MKKEIILIFTLFLLLIIFSLTAISQKTSPLLPDLTISSDDIEVSLDGEELTITATIKNIGNVDARGIDVLINIGNISLDESIKEIKAKGERKIKAGPILIGKTIPADLKVVITVDPDNVIKESNENNNKAEKSVKKPIKKPELPKSISEQPKIPEVSEEEFELEDEPTEIEAERPIPTLSGVTPSSTDTTKPQVIQFDVQPRSITEGGKVKITYTVKDSGGSGLNRVELWRKKDDENWKEIGRQNLSGNGPVSKSFLDTPTPCGTYYYGIHVHDNAGNWVTETTAGHQVKSVIVLNPSPPIVVYGNLHSHTQYSDAKLSIFTINPSSALENAFQNGLNFMAVTDHGGHLTQSEWDSTLSEVKDFNQKKSWLNLFVALRGFEWTGTWGGLLDQIPPLQVTGTGHINIFLSTDYTDAQKFGNGDLPEENLTKSLPDIYTWILNSKGVIAQFNHPSLYDNSDHFYFFENPKNFMKEDGRTRLYTDDQVKNIIGKFALIEMGSHLSPLAVGYNYEGGGNGTNPKKDNEYWYRLALKNGWKVAPSNNEDNHLGNYGGMEYGVLVFRTGVWVDCLTRKKLVDAIKKRHVFSTEDRNAWVKFFADNGDKKVFMGESIKPYTSGQDKKVNLTVEVSDKIDNDCEEESKIGSIEIVEIRRDTLTGKEPTKEITKDKVGYVSVKKDFKVDDKTICFYARITIKVKLKDQNECKKKCRQGECWKSLYSAPIWIK